MGRVEIDEQTWLYHCTVEELLQRLKNTLEETSLLNDGAPCRVLEPGKPWQQGRIRIVVEFQPDEPQA